MPLSAKSPFHPVNSPHKQKGRRIIARLDKCSVADFLTFCKVFFGGVEYGTLTHTLSQRERGNIPLFRGVSDRTGCSRPHPCPLIAGEGFSRGIWCPHPCPLSEGEGWPVVGNCRLPRQASPATPSEKGNIPLFRGVSDRRGVHFRSVADYPVRHSPTTPSEKGNLAPSPVPSPSGRGVAKRLGIFPSKEGCPKDGVFAPSPIPSPRGRGVVDRKGKYGALTHALSHWERGGHRICSLAGLPA